MNKKRDTIRWNLPVQLLTFLLILTACKQTTGFKPAPGTAYFKYVKYQGNDTYYNQHALDAQHLSNPILQGFYPDPSICKKGDDYYLVNSTFSFFPGVPIFHSKNLVQWTQVGNVLDKPSQFKNTNKPVSAGIYAPAISYNSYNNTFYMVTTFIGGGGNFVVTTKNPEETWSDPNWLPEVGGIDPSLFFDSDNKAYICNNQDPDGKKLYKGHTSIWLQEFDLTSNKMVGPRKMIRSGGHDIKEKPIWLEGPHMYKKNGYYYLMAAEGGTGINHSVVVFRSKNIWGPYESNPNNPILTQRSLDPDRDNPVTNTGHADLFQTENGEWYAVFLGCRPYTNKNEFNLGRETFMLPARWNEEWPVILEHGLEVPLQIPKPTTLVHSTHNGIIKQGNFSWEDCFGGDSLDFSWVFLRTPQKQWYHFPEKDNGIVLNLRDVNLRESKQASALFHRQQHNNVSFETSLRFAPQDSTEMAGLVFFQNEAFHLILGVTKIGEDVCVVVQKAQDAPGVVRTMSASNYKAKIPKVILAKKVVNLDGRDDVGLRISMQDGQFNFAVNTTGQWEYLLSDYNATYLSTSKAGGFIGTMMGIYASSNE